MSSRLDQVLILFCVQAGVVSLSRPGGAVCFLGLFPTFRAASMRKVVTTSHALVSSSFL